MPKALAYERPKETEQSSVMFDRVVLLERTLSWNRLDFWTSTDSPRNDITTVNVALMVFLSPKGT